MTNIEDESADLLMPPEQEKFFDERVSHLEILVARLQTGQESIVRELSKQSDSLAEITNSLQNVGKTNWGNVFAAIAVVVAIIGSIGNSFITPIKIVSDSNLHQIREMQVEIKSLEHKQSLIRERASVIEFQLNNKQQNSEG